MHSPEAIISVGQLCCSKQAALLCITDSFWSMQVLPQQNVVKRKNVELSAEGGIDTAFNSRGGDLRLTYSTWPQSEAINPSSSSLLGFFVCFLLLLLLRGGYYFSNSLAEVVFLFAEAELHSVVN